SAIRPKIKEVLEVITKSLQENFLPQVLSRMVTGISDLFQENAGKMIQNAGAQIIERAMAYARGDNRMGTLWRC
ncbi:unnamed protein product, partial [Amoebophrya sp. A25]